MLDNNPTDNFEEINTIMCKKLVMMQLMRLKMEEETAHVIGEKEKQIAMLE